MTSRALLSVRSPRKAGCRRPQKQHHDRNGQMSSCHKEVRRRWQGRPKDRSASSSGCCPSTCFSPLNAHCDAHATADAQGGEALFRVPLLHLIVLVVILAAMLVVGAVTQTLAQGKVVRGPGAISCGTWTKDSKFNQNRYAAEIAWIMGYLSARNLQSEYSDFLKGTDNNAISEWIDKYCRANPQSEVTDAANALVEEYESHLPPRRSK